MKKYGLDEIQDLIIVGAGPASLATLHEAQRRGLRALAIDKGPLCSALLQHPTHMRWFSTTDKLELAGFPLLTNEKNPTRREYLQYCRAFARYFDLKVVTYHEVRHIIPLDGLFRIEAVDIFGRGYVWRSRNIVLATGFYDTPRQLNIPGEELPKVSHRFSEVHYYADHDVLIIGAGSSAAEVALELHRAGTNVTVVLRGDRFHTKYWIEPDIENRIREGSIACYRNANVTAIREDDVIITTAGGTELTVPNDFVLAMTGYVPDTSMLESTGARVDKTTGKPFLTPNLESTVPGLYVAGTLCAGCESNVIFVENSREHGALILDNILKAAPGSLGV